MHIIIIRQGDGIHPVTTIQNQSFRRDKSRLYRSVMTQMRRCTHRLYTVRELTETNYRIRYRELFLFVLVTKEGEMDIALRVGFEVNEEAVSTCNGIRQRKVEFFVIEEQTYGSIGRIDTCSERL